MKNLSLLLGLLFAFALSGYSQATPSKLVRVATTTTDFAINLPAGTFIYCVADSTAYVVASAGIVLGKDIVDGLNESTIYRMRTTVENSGTRGAVNYALVVDSTKSTYQALELLAATTSYAGVMSAADKTKLDGIIAGSGVAYAENFEIAADGDDQTITLTLTPLDSTNIVISLNGVELSMVTPYDQWDVNLGTKVLTFRIPVYKYDAVSVSYAK